jgi:hypothetical protein
MLSNSDSPLFENEVEIVTDRASAGNDKSEQNSCKHNSLNLS